MTIDLSWATAETIATSLDHARSALDDTAGSAPEGIDAGVATALVTALVGRVSESAAGLSEGLAAASSKVSRQDSRSGNAGGCAPAPPSTGAMNR